MAAPMEKTRHPGIYKRGSRYVVVWRHKGRQHKSFHPTLAEAREAKGQRQGGDRRPVTRQSFEDYVHEWLDGYRGRTSRGLSNRTRNAYRSALVDRAVPFFRSYKLAEVEPPDVRRFIAQLEAEGLAPSSFARRSPRFGRCSPLLSRTEPYGRTRPPVFESTVAGATGRRSTPRRSLRRS